MNFYLFFIIIIWVIIFNNIVESLRIDVDNNDILNFIALLISNNLTKPLY